MAATPTAAKTTPAKAAPAKTPTASITGTPDDGGAVKPTEAEMNAHEQNKHGTSVPSTQTDNQQTQVRDANVTSGKTHFDADTLAAIKMAPAWRPGNDDKITGEVVAIVKRKHEEYGDYPMVVLKVAGEFTAVHAFHGVLLNELKELKTKRGDEVTITYVGKRQANKLNADGSAKNYHGYSVVPSQGGELDTFEF